MLQAPDFKFINSANIAASRAKIFSDHMISIPQKSPLQVVRAWYLGSRTGSKRP